MPETVVYRIDSWQAIIFGFVTGGSFGTLFAIVYWGLDKVFG